MFLRLSDFKFLKQGAVSNYDSLPMQRRQDSPANAVLKGFGINRLDILLLCKAHDGAAQGML
jgi:hypothetical protein